MTAEQEKQFQTAKLNDHRAAYTGAFMSTSMRDRRNLIAIIDDLQKQQPKRYTEAELRIEFESQFHGQTIERDRLRPDRYSDRELTAEFSGWLDCARFLGMIKTEGES